MCLNKLLEKFKKEKENLPKPVNDESFQLEVLTGMKILIDNKIYLKADELCRFLGGDSLQGLLSRVPNPQDFRSHLIGYSSYTPGNREKSYAPMPGNIKKEIDFNNPSIHYAFGEDIIPIWENELKTAEEQYLCGILKKFFEILKAP